MDEVPKQRQVFWLTEPGQAVMKFPPGSGGSVLVTGRFSKVRQPVGTTFLSFLWGDAGCTQLGTEVQLGLSSLWGQDMAQALGMGHSCPLLSSLGRPEASLHFSMLPAPGKWS